ncbi:hypothetical protein IT397_00030 [Candidatus Nomurabacteria bacterium]|nr:hypothetical protein [Candidatus Nomurabacteria bacterium]
MDEQPSTITVPLNSTLDLSKYFPTKNTPVCPAVPLEKWLNITAFNQNVIIRAKTDVKGDDYLSINKKMFGDIYYDTYCGVSNMVQKTIPAGTILAKIPAGTSIQISTSDTVGVQTGATGIISFDQETTTLSSPSTPTGLIAVPGDCGSGKINISWNPSNGATNYILSRDLNTTVYSGSSNSFTQNYATPGTEYSYAVKAVNSSGSSNYSSSISVTAPSACITPVVNLESIPDSSRANLFEYSVTSNVPFSKLEFTPVCNSNEITIEAKGNGLVCNTITGITSPSPTTKYSYPASFSSLDGKSHTIGMKVTAYANGSEIGTDKDVQTITPTLTSTQSTVTTTSIPSLPTTVSTVTGVRSITLTPGKDHYFHVLSGTVSLKDVTGLLDASNKFIISNRLLFFSSNIPSATDSSAGTYYRYQQKWYKYGASEISNETQIPNYFIIRSSADSQSNTITIPSNVSFDGLTDINGQPRPWNTTSSNLGNNDTASLAEVGQQNTWSKVINLPNKIIQSLWSIFTK